MWQWIGIEDLEMFFWIDKDLRGIENRRTQCRAMNGPHAIDLQQKEAGNNSYPSRG